MGDKKFNIYPDDHIEGGQYHYDIEEAKNRELVENYMTHNRQMVAELYLQEYPEIGVKEDGETENSRRFLELIFAHHYDDIFELILDKKTAGQIEI